VTEAYVIDALRTPVGRYGGALANARPDDLAAHVIRAAVERNGLPAGDVADVYMGCTNQAGEDNRNVARMGSLLAGLPVEVPGVTVNRLCASGLDAVNQASRALRLGDGDLLLAGGVESMSRAPLAMPKPDRSFPRGDQTVYDTTLGWRFVNPRMEKLYSTESMGETAENVAERYRVSRADQDEFALESHRRAIAAAAAGRFDS
jgi:acetyl-CoA acetyltransferase family protein